MEAYGIAIIVVTRHQKRTTVMNMLKQSILFMGDTLAQFVERLWKQAIPIGVIKLNLILNNDNIIFVCLDVDSAIHEKLSKVGGLWHCNDCSYQSSNKAHVFEHVEAKHIVHSGYICQICEKVLKTSASYRMHFKKCQSQIQ